ncbi:MAG: hypothetical protein KA190_08595 [Kofleriaceae bacterium]|jgi:hypothetical protein|nr:hypothetical protein [Kofleriaceae bacterium]
MKSKFLILSSALALAFALVHASATSNAGAPCKRTKFETVAMKDACAKGGQAQAKAEMKKFMKAAKAANPKINGCPACHSKVGGDYPLKANGLQLYKDAGGK